jgi:3-methyladenine DNA glycosylase AlkD
MTAAEIVRELEALGSAGTRRVLMNHGAREPVFGVKIGDMKPMQKRVRKDYPLSLALFETGNYDAQYFAGLIADETRMTPADLRQWLAGSNCAAIRGSIVAAVAAETPHGEALAREWIDSGNEEQAHAGWTTLSFLVALREDAALDMEELQRRLAQVAETIHDQPDRARYAMNGFVISLGSYVPALTQAALDAGERIGPVTADMGDTACQVPFAPDYIRKVQARGTVGKKRKTARC